MLKCVVAAATISFFAPQMAFAQSETESATDSFQRVFGIKRSSDRVPDTLLKTLQKLQEQRQAVPADPEAYKTYVEQNPLVRYLRSNRPEPLVHLLLWNHFALDATSIDHTTLGQKPAEPTYAEQLGPHRASRALAIVHLAMFEAVNAIYRDFESYQGIQGKIFAAPGVPQDVRPETVSVKTAIAYAAYETLNAVYRQKAAIHFSNLVLAESLIGDSDEMRRNGQAIGTAAAKAVLAARNYDEATKVFNDGSKDGLQYQVQANSGSPYEKSCAGDKADRNSLCLEPFIYQDPNDPTHPFKVANKQDLEHWQQDPVTKLKLALGGDWPETRPFVLPSDYKFPTQPPSYTDQKFKDAYLLGGYGGTRNGGYFNKYGVRKFGQNVSQARKEDLTFRARFWGYDGTALLCAPPRLYNMIATSVAETPGPTQINRVQDMARYLALVNLALSDAGVAAWAGKYQYSFPRPITYIKNHEGDQVIDGTANKDWLPLGFAGTNSTTLSGTPPFPSYPSGHAVFGGAFFQIMSRFFNLPKDSPKTKFTFVSDEFNGVNRGEDGKVRPRRPVTYKTFADAEWENAESRMWMGIHWQFDGDDGIAAGNALANTVYEGALKKKLGS